MSFLYYSQPRETDDDDEEVKLPKPWDAEGIAAAKGITSGPLNSTPKAEPVNETKIITKDTFGVDFDFFENKRSGFAKGSRSYWDWTRFINYAKTVVRFYAQALSAYNEIYLNKQITFGYNESLQELKNQANNLSSAEMNLNIQFGRRNVGVFLKETKKVSRVVDLAAEAWTIYHTLVPNVQSDEKDLSSIIKCSKALKNSLNSDGELKDIEIFRNARSMSRRCAQNGLTTFLPSCHISDFYNGQDANVYLNKMLEMSGWVKIDELGLIVNKTRASLQAGENKDFAIFYDKYEFMKYLVDKIAWAVQKWEKEFKPIDIFTIESSGDDAYLLAEKWLKFCAKLLDKAKEINFRYTKDIQIMTSELRKALNDGNIAYQEHNAYHKQLDEEVKEFLSKIKKPGEN